jgi:predicted phage tail protein
MTDIILHGILAKEFGERFTMKINKAKNVVKAIDINRKNFYKRIIELSKEGLNYTLIVDGKKITETQELGINKEPKEIHLLPMIVGSGPVAVGTAIVSVVAGSAAAAAISTTTAFIIGSIALAAVSIGLSMLLSPKPDAGPPISSSTKAMSESFSFSNKVNVASQGSPVPVGYGRLLVGGQVIQFAAKSFPQSKDSLSAMRQNAYIPVTQTDTSISQSVSTRTV